MKKLLLTLLLLLLPLQVFGAVTIDSTNSGTDATDPLVMSRIIATGATLDVVLCQVDSGSTPVTSVTRSTDTYTELAAAQATASGATTTIWYKTNPLSGTLDVTASVAAQTIGISCWGISFFGSDTVNPFSTQTGVGDGSADMLESNSVTAATGEIVIDVLGINDTAITALTVGANQTDIVSTENTGSGHAFAGSHQAGADGGTMSWTWATTNSTSAHSIAVVKAAPLNRPVAPIIFQ